MLYGNGTATADDVRAAARIRRRDPRCFGVGAGPLARAGLIAVPTSEVWPSRTACKLYWVWELVNREADRALADHPDLPPTRATMTRATACKVFFFPSLSHKPTGPTAGTAAPRDGGIVPHDSKISL